MIYVLIICGLIAIAIVAKLIEIRIRIRRSIALPKRFVIDRSGPEPDLYIKYFALQQLIYAARDLVAQRPDDPQLDAIKAALEYYKDYWT